MSDLTEPMSLADLPRGEARRSVLEMLVSDRQSALDAKNIAVAANCATRIADLLQLEAGERPPERDEDPIVRIELVGPSDDDLAEMQRRMDTAMGDSLRRLEDRIAELRALQTQAQVPATDAPAPADRARGLRLVQAPAEGSKQVIRLGPSPAPYRRTPHGA